MQSLQRPGKSQSILTFAPLAWLKLQFFCHAGDTEIGGFGISSEQDLLYVEDFLTVRQQVTATSVHFEDGGVADFFDQCVDRKLHPEQFSRIWCHTHPGASVTPSGIDEETFQRSFGRCDWSLMFILGRTGLTYARLAFAVGPGAQLTLPTMVDWPAWPEWSTAEKGLLESELAQWQQQYAAHIQLRPQPVNALQVTPMPEALENEGWWDNYPWYPELDEITCELAEESNFHEPSHHSTVPGPRHPPA